MSRVSSWAIRVVSLPSWYRSMRGLGIGRIKGGWSLVVGYVFVEGRADVGSPIWGISAKSAW